MSTHLPWFQSFVLGFLDNFVSTKLANSIFISAGKEKLFAQIHAVFIELQLVINLSVFDEMIVGLFIVDLQQVLNFKS